MEPPRFATRPAFDVTGLQTHYDRNTAGQIGSQWQHLMPQIASIPGWIRGKAYGVISNTTADCDFDYLAGVETALSAKLPENFQRLTIPAGRYAVFSHRGPVFTISQTAASIWNEWLPASGHRFAGSLWFEQYPEGFNPATDESGVEIWVPIES